MHVSRLLIVVILASACSAEPPVKPGATTDQPEATTGAEPAAPEVAAPEPTPRKPVERRDTAAADARAAASGPVAEAAATAGVNVPAAVLQDFKVRVDQYFAIHRKAVSSGGKLTETENPNEIAVKQDELAARIAGLRSGAKHGDVFTAEIRHAFRRLLAPELKGEDGRDARAILEDDAPPPGSVPLTVNAKYPEGLPLPTVPASLLLNLPALPKGIEYRIVGKHLVLLDSDANLIVDFIANAIA